MLFIVFVFLTAFIVASIVFGFSSKHPLLGISTVSLGFVVMLLTGGLLFSEGIRDDGSPTFTKTGDTVALTSFASLTITNSPTVLMLAHLYYYGSFLVLGLMGYLVVQLVKDRRGGQF